MASVKGTRFDAYVRVSRRMGREGESFQSPRQQRDTIEAWAALRGVEISAWHEDIDKSGGVLRRPGLDALMARIRAGDTDGVAIARLDRLSRAGVGDALKLVEEIHSAGGQIAAIDLGIDPTTAFGEFGMTIMLALARMDRRKYVEMWEISKANAVDRGAKIGPAPYGYVRVADGLLAEHPVTGPQVRRAFELAAGQGLAAAVEHMAAVRGDRKWTTSAVRRILANRCYLGESRYGERVNHHAHPPLVSRAVWEAAQTVPTGRRKAQAFPLTGLAVCGTCHGRMVGGRSGGNRGDSVRTYRCAATLSLHRGERCERGAHIVADRLERHVLELGRELLDALAGDVGSLDERQVTLAERTVLEAEAELDAFASDLTLRRALGGRYHEHLQERVEAVEAAQGEYRAIARRSQAQQAVFGDEVDLAGLADLLRGIGVSVLVEPGRAALGDRVRIEAAQSDRPSRVAGLEELDEPLLE